MRIATQDVQSRSTDQNNQRSSAANFFVFPAFSEAIHKKPRFQHDNHRRAAVRDCAPSGAVAFSHHWMRDVLAVEARQTQTGRQGDASGGTKRESAARRSRPSKPETASEVEHKVLISQENGTEASLNRQVQAATSEGGSRAGRIEDSTRAGNSTKSIIENAGSEHPRSRERGIAGATTSHASQASLAKRDQQDKAGNG